MVRFLLMTSSPDVSVIVQGQPLRSKSIVSPSAAPAIAWRSEPGPLSFVLVTVIVGACVAGTTDAAFVFMPRPTLHSARPISRLSIVNVIEIRRFMIFILSGFIVIAAAGFDRRFGRRDQPDRKT